MAFQQRHSGIAARWELIAPHLPQHPSWGLDIGSNLGDTSIRAAALGHTMIGIETSHKLVARAEASKPRNVAFMVGEVDPDSLSRMPGFDFMFMLSVLHRIWAVAGQAVAEECFRAALDKTERVLFEGSMRHARYVDHGRGAPDFESNNLDAAIAWHLDWLNGLAEPKGWRVRHLGSVPCSAKEPFRPVFLAERSLHPAEKATAAAGRERRKGSDGAISMRRGLRLRDRLDRVATRLLPGRVCYRGIVFSGIKKGTRVVPEHSELLSKLTGMSIVPGTLNVQLEKELALVPPVTFRAWRKGQSLTPAILNGVRVFLYRWPKCKLRRVEILSDTHLRSRLGLQDGDVVSVCIKKQFVQQQHS